MKNFRVSGKAPYGLVVVHGGPGSPGYMAPVARELAKDMGVLEPLQTKNSIDGQVEELADVLKKNANVPVVLIGHSWGATLSYMTTARYPALVKKLVLIGTSLPNTKNLPPPMPVWLSRLSEPERVEFLALVETIWNGVKEDKSASFGKFFKLVTKGDSYDMVPAKDEVLEYQFDMNVAISRELVKLWNNADLIDLMKKIKCPVAAIHGDADTSPAAAAEKTLSGAIKDFKFILLEKCGHYPWLEKYARDKFFKVLREEIV